MRLRITTPTQVRINEEDKLKLELVKAALTYTDKSVDYQIRRMKQARWFDAERHAERLEELQAQRRVSLVQEDEEGPYTLSGLANTVDAILHCGVESFVPYPSANMIPWAEIPPPLRPYQQETVDLFLRYKHAAAEMACHRRGERVVMLDGSLKEVQNIEVGDVLVGPDSQPRKVLETKTGIDTMYRIATTNGQEMYVNGHHLLVLKRTTKYARKSVRTPRKDYVKNRELVITVEDYLRKCQQSKTFRHLHKLFSVGVEFASQPIPIDPYFLGVVLGDGHVGASVNVTTMDPEIEDAVRQTAMVWGLKISVQQKANNRSSTFSLVTERGQPNNLLRELKKLGVVSGQKHIPHIYKNNSSKIRLAVLAGLIDTDGSRSDGCVDYISKDEALAQDVAFVARSLGLRATVRSCHKTCQTGGGGQYWRVTLSGDLSMIPTRLPRKRFAIRQQKKNALMFGFSVEKVSDAEEFFGFVLDSDHKYFTDTFLVTHNTGLGKSYILLHVAKNLGLKTIIMAPTTSIADQLYADFTRFLGKKYVGRFYGGKKELEKLFTVAIHASLARIERGTPAWDALSKTMVFIADESHLTPAATLREVCLGLCAGAPYRFFLSGTQMRADGADLLLRGITGPILKRMTVVDGVEQGYLAKPVFRIFPMTSTDSYTSSDPLKMTQRHFYYNPAIIKKAAALANYAVSQVNHQVLIAIDEIEQFRHLIPYLRAEYKFAHGALTKEHLRLVPEAHQDSDTTPIVADFNAGKFPILIGTSAIGMGTDIRPVKTIINLTGGKSEVQIRQLVGRGTRKVEGKDECIIVDFDVQNIPMIHRHAEERVGVYADIYPDVEYL